MGNIIVRAGSIAEGLAIAKKWGIKRGPVYAVQRAGYGAELRF